MNIDGEFIVDTILVDVDNDNKSYYGYAEEKVCISNSCKWI